MPSKQTDHAEPHKKNINKVLKVKQFFPSKNANSQSSKVETQAQRAANKSLADGLWSRPS